MEDSADPARHEEATAAAEEELHYNTWRAGLLEVLHTEGGHQLLTPRSEGGVGLLNLGSTCYMNTLLQVLFHTPELRQALYRWCHKDKGAESSVPLQLQRLFAQLQLSQASAVSTRPLVKALGWRVGEQQDIQEFLRLFFEALECSSSDLAAIISALYSGSLVHYVQSLEAEEDGAPETKYQERFLDLQVPIQGCASLEDALSRYVEPELLDGGNQWFCEALGRKVDALKGVRFESLPPLLCLQLIRFVFDPVTLQREKLNEVLSVPVDLDLGSLLGSAAGAAAYELAAVCLHSGTVHGGHYRAYIRELQQSDTEATGFCWRDVNDADVAVIGPEKSKALFSGGEAHSAGLEEFVGIMYVGNDIKDLPCGSLDEARMIAAREVTSAAMSAGYAMAFGRIWIKHSARDNHPSVRMPEKAPGSFMFYLKLEEPEATVQEFRGLFYGGGQALAQMPCHSLDEAREIAKREVTDQDTRATYSKQMGTVFVHSGARESHPYRTPPETGDSNVYSFYFAGAAGAEAEVREGRRSLMSSDAYFVVYRRAGFQTSVPGNSEVPVVHRAELLKQNAYLWELQRAYRFHQHVLEVRVFAPPEAHNLLKRHAAVQLDAFLGGPDEVGVELQGHWEVRFTGGSYELQVGEAGRVVVVGSNNVGRLRHATGEAAAAGWVYQADGHHGTGKFDLIKVSAGQLVMRHWAGFFWLDALAVRLWRPGEAQSVMVPTHRESSVSHLLRRALRAFALEANGAAWAWAADLAAAQAGQRDWPPGRLHLFDWTCGQVGPALHGEANCGGALSRHPSGREHVDLLLEIGDAGESWDEGRACVAVCRWDSQEAMPSLGPRDLLNLKVPLAPQSLVPTLGAVRAAAAAAFGVAAGDCLALVPMAGSQAGKALSADEQTLSEIGVEPTCVLCAEVPVAEDGRLASAALYESARIMEA